MKHIAENTMKKIFASLLVLSIFAGAGQAHAWFWNKTETNNELQYRQAEKPRQNIAYKQNSEDKKWIYNGNNGYKTIAGQIAREDRMDDGDNNAFIVHRTHETHFNGSLRQGDTGQSMQTRLNHSFNN